MPILGSQAEQTREPVLSRVAGLPGLIEKLTPAGKMRDLYRRAQESPDGLTPENLLSAMRIRLRVGAADQACIPNSGPVVVVANHPHGVLDGAILAILLRRARPDVKILTNIPLDDIPELAEHSIFVDTFQSDHSMECNQRAMRQALAWLKSGNVLAVFPAGEIPHFQMPLPQIADPAWNETAVRLIRSTGAAALPVYFCGHSGMGFQLLGLIHPRLRAAFVWQQLMEQQGKTIEVRIGSEIPNRTITEIAHDRDATEYLRWRTYLLARRKKSETFRPAILRSRLALRPQQLIAPEISRTLLEQEVAGMAPDRCLIQNGDLAVYLGSARENPHLLHEVCRLRELTFRQAGEGTGKSIDRDRFDDYYWHILLWNQSKRELVGAYRAGNTAEILASYGIHGLYTSTLFRYKEGIFDKLGPALELGRSFVRPEYQRQYAPLMLLWKGIARLIALRPEIAVLFGAVSVSNEYSKASREMIYRFFKSRMREDDLASLVEPRQPFRPGLLHHWECRGMWQAIRDLDQLSHPIKDVESDGKGLPILLRQYDKLGGRLVAFNVDRKFSDVLDGLVVVDLRQTDPAVLGRYMGPEASTRFRELHATAK